MKPFLLICLVAACGGGSGFPDASDAAVQVDPGSFSLSWSLTSASGQALTCAQANAVTVHVGITDHASGDRSSASFNCGNGVAVSGAVFASTYDVSFTLLDMSAATLATAATQTVVVQPDRTTQADPVVFVVPAG